MVDVNPHPELSFALDVADKAIKLAAVLLGGVWTYWNYRKGRKYAQKVELQLTGAVFEQGGICFGRYQKPRCSKTQAAQRRCVLRNRYHFE